MGQRTTRVKNPKEEVKQEARSSTVAARAIITPQGRREVYPSRVPEVLFRVSDRRRRRRVSDIAGRRYSKRERGGTFFTHTGYLGRRERKGKETNHRDEALCLTD